MPETTSTVSYALAFAVVSGGQVVITELLRVWEPLRWITNRVFGVWAQNHEIGGVKEFFWGTADQQKADAQEEFRRRRALVVHIAGLGSAVTSLCVGFLASLLALVASVLILAFSTASRFWLVLTLGLVVVEVLDLVQLFQTAAAGTLSEVPVRTVHGAIKGYWCDLRDPRTPAPYAATVVLVNIFVVLLSLLLA
jgi:hypothetical protein